jgi:hypothetical protein
VLLITAVNCSAPESRETRTTVTRSHVTYVDSTLGSLRPVQHIVLTVRATATYDVAAGLWNYTYSVTNEPVSGNALETFAVTPLGKPERIVSPPHWMGSYGSEGDSTAVAWSVVDLGPAPPGWDGAQLFQGPYHPTPGQTVHGFTIVSHQSPEDLNFHAQGFDTLQTGGEEGVESAPTVFVEGVAGTTIGPGMNGR